MKIRIKKIHPDAKTPRYAHDGDAGMDVFACEKTRVPAGGRAMVPTGIAMEIPKGYVGLVWDKSGLAMKKGLKTIGGVIDAGYRGEILIGIANMTRDDYVFEKGDKVAQILIQKVEAPELEEAEELSDTARGAGGFGSTGKA